MLSTTSLKKQIPSSSQGATQSIIAIFSTLLLSLSHISASEAWFLEMDNKTANALVTRYMKKDSVAYEQAISQIPKLIKLGKVREIEFINTKSDIYLSGGQKFPDERMLIFRSKKNKHEILVSGALKKVQKWYKDHTADVTQMNTKGRIYEYSIGSYYGVTQKLWSGLAMPEHRAFGIRKWDKESNSLVSLEIRMKGQLPKTWTPTFIVRQNKNTQILLERNLAEGRAAAHVVGRISMKVDGKKKYPAITFFQTTLAVSNEWLYRFQHQSAGISFSLDATKDRASLSVRNLDFHLQTQLTKSKKETKTGHLGTQIRDNIFILSNRKPTNLPLSYYVSGGRNATEAQEAGHLILDFTERGHMP